MSPGREREAEFDLYYYRARYYDPMIGRFMSRDPLGFAAGDVNLYRYVGNQPINFNDPFGLYSVNQFGYDMASFWVGVGDAASFGLTSWIRSTDLYGESYVNTCSGWYTGGQITGGVATGIITGGTAEFSLANRLFANSWIRNRAFRWGIGNYNLPSGRAARGIQRLHIHLGPAMRYHLPADIRTWYYHSRSIIRNVFR